MNSVDIVELTQEMLEWRELKTQLDDLEARIKMKVLRLQKTQTVADVRASYSGGRKTYDYEGAGQAASPEIITAHTKTVTTVDWRKVCRDAGIEAPVASKSDPGVTLKWVK
ncbi:MAG: hypothetical protein GF334_03180 [Candidatus Altiarchaeales archaeon]|nr:hypothetical protein [Candidatus Altiarchaeales archaeon]